MESQYEGGKEKHKTWWLFPPPPQKKHPHQFECAQMFSVWYDKLTCKNAISLLFLGGVEQVWGVYKRVVAAS